jgi:hypothetical protein
MKQEFKNIIKQKVYYKLLSKKTAKKTIIKSIIQNNEIDQETRFLSQIKVDKLLKSKKSNKNKNICLLTGKQSSIWNFCNFSRHSIKNLNIHGKLQNIKLLG